jgi:hypothetical protein
LLSQFFGSGDFPQMRCTFALLALLFISVLSNGQINAGDEQTVPVRTSTSFCNRTALSIPRNQVINFADYKFEVDATGRPVQIKKSGVDKFKDDSIAKCIANWSIIGAATGSGFLVSWKYENGQVIQTVSGAPVTLSLQVRDTRPDPPGTEQSEYDTNETFGDSETSLSTIIPNKLILKMFELPELSMARAMEIAVHFAEQHGFTKDRSYLTYAQIEFDVDQSERYWLFHWFAIIGRPLDLSIRVSMKGLPSVAVSP